MSYGKWKNWFLRLDETEQDTLLMAAAKACEFTGDAEEVVLFSYIARAHFDIYSESVQREEREDVIQNEKEDTAQFVYSLKKRRIALNMSVQEVADKIGVHVTTYRMWERMATEPSPENMLKLIDLFLR